MIEVPRRKSELRCMILREPRAQLRNHQDPWAAELDGRLDIRLLLAAEVSERAANWQHPSQGVGGSGMVTRLGPVKHGDDGGDEFEGVMRDAALGRQPISVKITDPVGELT